ncbi:hypothetical protein ACDF64_04315 [Agromyces sp. MMS24-JH15]|uniref:hypothetical protein n=1 Tax=Agromyces sp. MMS24-JH15 TaxID=3243765 RepID=UPI0037490D91
MELDDLARALDARVGATVLIDGRSGAGKSTLATRLGALRPAAVVLRLDAVYPGWDGLAWACEHLHREVLAPRAAGRPAAWRAWDWAEDRPADRHAVPADRPLVVEGVGALTARNRALADLGVWVEADDRLRRSRALARDGDTYAPHWERWAAQEADFIARHRPEASADVIARPTRSGFALEAARTSTPADRTTTPAGAIA